MLSIAGGEEERGRAPAGRAALLRFPGCSLGCRQQAWGEERGPTSGGWTQKGEPDMGTLARDALHQPPSSPMHGPWVCSCPPMLTQGKALPVGAGGRQVGGGGQAGTPQGDGKQRGWGTPERAQARGHWGLSPPAMRPPQAPSITLQSEGVLLPLESCFGETGSPPRCE